MNVREFTEIGIGEFRQFLSRARQNENEPFPEALLTDAKCAVVVSPAIEVEFRRFGDRRAAADYLCAALAPLDSGYIASSAGLWSWLSLYYFDEVCPQKRGQRSLKNDYHYIFEPANPRHYYRHLLHLAWRIKTLAPQHNRLLLNPPLSTLDGVTTEVMKRLYLSRVPCIFEVLDRLYWDPKRRSPRPGIVNVVAKAGDLANRLPIRIRQLEKNYDLVSLQAAQLIELLGSEFEFAERQ